ncbi:MAG: hypothetical protein AMXMBFR8_30670 [Nevskiales bacterium]
MSLVLFDVWGVAGAAGPATATLVSHHQKSGTSLSTLIWNGANTVGVGGMTVGAEASTATWTWDGTTLTGMGLYFATSHIGSMPAASSVIGDRVVDLSINTATDTTTATDYQCREGNFLNTVGAHGCGNINLDYNATYDSAIAYNVGGDASCVSRTLGGDDMSTGNPRGLTNRAAAGACDATDSSFILWEVVQNPTVSGGTLQISNLADITANGSNYMTFTVAATANDDGPVDAPETVAVPIAVLANDALFTDPVSVSITTAPTKGNAVVNGSPGNQAGVNVTYTANSGASGTDTFEYEVCSSGGTPCDSATVTLNVLPFGANPDTATTTLNTLVNIPVGANDAGFTDPVTVTISVPPDQGGAAVPSAPGATAGQTIAFTPAAPAMTPTYTETFTYQITDGTLTDTAVVTVTVNNNVPNAADGGVTISTQGVAPAGASGSFTAPGPGGNLGDPPVTVDVTAQGTKGTATPSGNTVAYAVTDAAFFTGTDQFTYRITDKDSEQDTGIVTVTIPDVSPALANGTLTAGTALDLTSRITAGNGSVAQHTLAVTTQGAGGSCALSGTSLTYTANAGFSGADSCVVTLTDGDGDTDTGTFSVTVAGGGGGGGSGITLPGGSSALDAWTLAMLAGGAWVARRRRGGR